MTTAQPRLLVAAAASGSGKTTIVCGLLAALHRRGRLNRTRTRIPRRPCPSAAPDPSNDGERGH